jgi:hypothetical protein
VVWLAPARGSTIPLSENREGEGRIKLGESGEGVGRGGPDSTKVSCRLRKVSCRLTKVSCRLTRLAAD